MRLLLHLVCTLLLLSCANCIDDPGVVIIGAGAAGIAAASRLYKNGFKNLTILEAEDRIGGRVYSLKLGDSYIDLGAQWCHGEKDNVVYELVKDLNVLNDDFFVPLFYHSKRKLIDTEFTVKMTEIFETTYGNVSTDQKGPLGEYLTTRYNEATRDAWKDNEDKLALAADCLHSFRIWVEGYEAAFSWFDVAASSIYEVCEGNSALGWNGLGYKTILDVLMEKSAKSITDKVLLNHVVKQVVRSDSKVEVKCTNGASFTSDHVIWTPSLGVLKRGYKTLFTPQLSGEKVQAIQTLGMNAVLKVGLYFPTKWWNDDFRGVVFSWAASDLQKSGEAFPYGPKTGNKSWITTIICVTSVPKSPNLLLAWLAGALVPEIEKTSDETITDGVIYTLREFMGEDYPNITRPDRVIRKNWYIDPHFHGTYSFETVESRKLGRPQAEVLGEPILSDEGKPILLFAGEATNPRHHSTVHGAIESGFREADRLIELYRRF
uniref:Amine oxidase domain-containing protein n=1 Tax=Photinus pyralis TaxID=7054 RepID=A0A1Y1MGD7_PHOPY